MHHYHGAGTNASPPKIRAGTKSNQRPVWGKSLGKGGTGINSQTAPLASELGETRCSQMSQPIAGFASVKSLLPPLTQEPLSKGGIPARTQGTGWGSLTLTVKRYMNTGVASPWRYRPGSYPPYSMFSKEILTQPSRHSSTPSVLVAFL